jgi:tRNA(Ile)-lysidine synthetase-like protein
MDLRPPVLNLVNLPPGPWAIGVSGGADSVALLLLLRDQSSFPLHVAHLDHELRGPQSTADAEFVQELSAKLHLPCTVARRTQIEPTLSHLPHNRSARYRAIRLGLFRRVVADHHLNGVLLAHHADDQAETILHRLLRSSPPSALAGMSPLGTIDGLPIARPLLALRRDQLRAYLTARNQSWREDPSNSSDAYLRNRLRKILAARPELTDALMSVASACRALTTWTNQSAPTLQPRFPAASLQSLPSILAKRSATRWLRSAGSPPDELSGDCLMRLVAMAADAATPPAQQFPGGLTIRRRAGKIWSEKS